MEDRRLPVEPERGRAGALGYAAMATRLRPVIRGRTVLVVRFFILLTHWGALTPQYDERLSPPARSLAGALGLTKTTTRLRPGCLRADSLFVFASITNFAWSAVLRG